MCNRTKGRTTMAQTALHVCNKCGCHRLTHNTYCELHQHLKRQYDDHRESASKRGYNGRWRKASKTYLLSHPFCIRCLQQGKYEKATVVDHITPHKGNQLLFWDRNNWQPLCKQCHDRKTATEDGGFGR